MQIINLKLTDIHPYEHTPRNNDLAVAAVARSRPVRKSICSPSSDL